MRVVMSAYSEEALIYGEQDSSVYSRACDEVRQVSSAQARQWLNSHGELKSADVSDIDELRQVLGYYSDCRVALRLALYSIDPSLSKLTRDMAVEEIHPLISQSVVRIWLDDLFFLQPLPSDSIEIAGETIGFARARGYAEIADFLSSVLEFQETISRLSGIWDQIEITRFLGASHSQLLEQLLGTGFFKKIVCEQKIVPAVPLAQAAVLNVRVPFDLETKDRVGLRMPIDCGKSADLIGFSQALEGIEYHNYWESALAGNVFVISRNNTDPFHRGGVSVHWQELMVKLEGREGWTPIPKGLYTEATFRFSKELERPRQRFEFAPPPDMIPDLAPVKQACETLSKWARNIGKGVSNVVNSVGAIRLGE